MIKTLYLIPCILIAKWSMAQNTMLIANNGITGNSNIANAALQNISMMQNPASNNVRVSGNARFANAATVKRVPAKTDAAPKNKPAKNDKVVHQAAPHPRVTQHTIPQIMSGNQANTDDNIDQTNYNQQLLMSNMNDNTNGPIALPAAENNILNIAPQQAAPKPQMASTKPVEADQAPSKLPKSSFAGSSNASSKRSAGKNYTASFSKRMTKLNRKLNYVFSRKKKKSFIVDYCFAWAK